MAKWFRVATEGATCDGRTIDKQWLIDAAKQYNPKTYGARINLEHIKSVLPDGPFKMLGDVTALKTAEQDGKTVLLAQIAPLPELEALAKSRQKIYTSCEFSTSFADTGKAYLVGLACTDSPASLGTDVLEFSAKQREQGKPSYLDERKTSPDCVFTVAAETVLDFSEDAEPEKGPSLADRVKAMFSRQSVERDGALRNEMADALGLFAERIEQHEGNTVSVATYNTLKEQHDALAQEFGALRDHLDKTPAATKRAHSVGSADDVIWAYKSSNSEVPNFWGWYDRKGWVGQPDIANDSAPSIAEKWRRWTTSNAFQRNDAASIRPN